jgi:hypothetical protein
MREIDTPRRKGKGLFWAAFGILLLAALALALPAQALPGGSYIRSCKDCMDDGEQLICQCSYKGKYSGTSIYYGLCEANSITNTNSKLTCTARGSFRKSCRDISWNASRLQAVCKTKKGKWNGTVLSGWRSCEGDIANCDGALTCGSCP